MWLRQHEGSADFGGTIFKFGARQQTDSWFGLPQDCVQHIEDIKDCNGSMCSGNSQFLIATKL